MAADGAIAGGTGAFVPATAGEMAGMGLGGGTAAMGGAAAGGGITDLGGGLSIGADGGIEGATGAFTPASGAQVDALINGTAGIGVPSTGALGGPSLPGAPPIPSSGGGGTPPNPFVDGASMIPTGGFDWTKLIGPALAGVGGIAGANAAEKAAETQLQSVRESNALLKDIFDKQVELQAPFRQGGINGLLRYQELLGVGGNPNAPDYGSAARDFTLKDFTADPGYEFRQAEQKKALERAASTRGGLDSGKFYKDAIQYSGDLASGEFTNAYNRFNLNRTMKLNPLQSLAGLGQTSANTLTGAAGNYGTQVANNITAGGNASAAGTIGSTNALLNGLGQGFSMYQNGLQMDQNQALMNALLRR